MNNHLFRIKLIHCGNRNIANPADNLEKHAFFMPIGLFALAGAIKKNGFDVEIIHLDLEGDKSIEEILDFDRLDAVGLDCHWVNQSLVVLNTAELIKKINPGVFVFLGGFTASFFAEEILYQYPYIDAIIRGDAEVPIVELCRVLHLKKTAGPFGHIPNLVRRGADGRVEFNEFSYVAAREDLENLDFAEMSLLRNWETYRDLGSFYSKFASLSSTPRFILNIGRGCVYACSFCGGNHKAQLCINNRKGQVIRPIDAVMSTIRKAISFGYTFFHIDFNFEDCEEYFITLFKRIKEEHPGIKIGFGCWGLPSKVFIDTISGCFPEAVIGISPETADHDLRKINKDLRLFYNNEEIEECLQYIGTKKNLKAQLYFGYFLPFDREETVFATLGFIEKMIPVYCHFAEFFYGNLSTDPASLLFFYPGKYEIDINLRCFDDYMTLLKKTYLSGSGAAPDITAFKPRGLAGKAVNRLSAGIRLFNDLFFCFEKTIVSMSKKTGKTNMISDYLRETEITMPGKGNFEPGELKKVLLNICKEHNVLDSEVLASIDEEYKGAGSSSTSRLRKFYSFKSGENSSDVKNEEYKDIPGKIKFQEDETNFDFE